MKDSQNFTILKCLMETHASLEDPTPTVTRPLHHTASVTLISPDSEQCEEDWH